MKARNPERSRFLIEEASKRLLTADERAELVFGLWRGSRNNFRRLVNRAYALANKHGRFGIRAKDRNELDRLFDKLGSADFNDLYRAVELFCDY